VCVREREELGQLATHKSHRAGTSLYSRPDGLWDYTNSIISGERDVSKRYTQSTLFLTL
jgi:hypothetical protein